MMTEASEALVLAKEKYQEAGIPFPFIPPEMAARVEQLGEWMFGTRHGVPSLYNFDVLITEVVTTPVEDYVLFGHDGHGMNSYAMHYHLVRGPLAIFTQLQWGGAYTSPNAANAIVEKYGQIKALLQTAETAQQAGKLAGDERVIVVVSDFTGSRWRRMQGYNEGMDALVSERWHESHDALDSVLRELRTS